MSPPPAFVELELSVTVLPVLFLSSDGSGLAAASRWAARRTCASLVPPSWRACAAPTAAPSTAFPSSSRTLIMLLMSKASAAHPTRTNRKIVIQTMAAPDSDRRWERRDDPCDRRVLMACRFSIGLITTSPRATTELPGARIVEAATGAAVLGPLPLDREGASRRLHRGAGTHRAGDEPPPRAAADGAGGAAGGVLGVRDG